MIRVLSSLQHSDWKANLVKDFFLNKFPPMRALKFITVHVIYNSAYTYKFQLKTTNMDNSNFLSYRKNLRKIIK